MGVDPSTRPSRQRCRHTIVAGGAELVATHEFVQASVAIVLIDLDGGYASVAAAGDCLALKIRAVGSDPIATRQPALGSIADFMYLGHSIQLAVRERIVLIADVPARRPENVTAKISNIFSRLDAETQRRMMAADAISLVRECFDQPADGSRLATSIVSVLRR